MTTNSEIESKSPHHKFLLNRIMALTRPLQPEPTGVIARNFPLPGIKAVLFDVYGTMVISASGEGTCLEGRHDVRVHQALESAGFRCEVAAGRRVMERLRQVMECEARQIKQQGTEYPEIDIRDIWKSVVRDLVAEGLVKGRVNRASIERLAVEYECRVNPVWPMPELEATITALHQAGLKIGIVSNAQFYTPLVLEAFPETGWSAGYIDPHCCVWSFKLKEAKPSVRLVWQALEVLAVRYHIDSRETIVVGNDMLNDILPAVQSGCKAALFAGDRRSYNPRPTDSRCVSLQPDLVLTRMSQLLAVVQ